MKKFLSLILIFGGLILAPTILASVGLGISPLVFELTGNPGDVIENQLKVGHTGENPIGIKMTIEDIAPSEESGLVVVKPAETETYSLASWIKCDPEKFTLNPGEEKWIKFTITIPENAEPGGHYGTVVAGAAVVSGTEMTGAAIANRVGALVLITVPGEMKETLAIKDFTAPRYSEYGPINFAVRIENTGTVHVKPAGLITITNWLGQKITDVSIGGKNVLPGAVRKFETTWNQKWLWAGRYTATLTGVYGISNTPLTPTVITFWAFPWKFGLLILAIFILLILARRRLFTALRILIKGR